MCIMGKLYIAGPMTGIPQFNIPAFDALAAKLRAKGNTVVSPAELDSREIRQELLASADGQYAFGSTIGATKMTWADFLARDVKLIADEIDEIVVLPDWWKSRGARLEVFVGLLSKKLIYRWRDDNAPYELCRIPNAAALEEITKGFMRDWS
jgi:hypothetical protein